MPLWACWFGFGAGGVRARAVVLRSTFHVARAVILDSLVVLQNVAAADGTQRRISRLVSVSPRCAILIFYLLAAAILYLLAPVRASPVLSSPCLETTCRPFVLRVNRLQRRSVRSQPTAVCHRYFSPLVPSLFVCICPSRGVNSLFSLPFSCMASCLPCTAECGRLRLPLPSVRPCRGLFRTSSSLPSSAHFQFFSAAGRELFFFFKG